jgi:hypothetical protein
VNGIIEVNPPRAEAALALKREGYTASSYENATIYKTVEEYHELVQSGKKVQPKCV